jgi:IclR family KDG regulon transcriptional repressor
MNNRPSLVPATQTARSARDSITAERQGVDGVKSAVRVLAIIRLLTVEKDGVKFSDVCEHLRLPKSSAHALLGTMTDEGFLTIDANTRVYRIGVRLWEAGQTYVHSFDLERVARPFMEAVRDALRETVQLAILDGTDNVYVAKVESDQLLVLQSRVGTRLPAYATGLGKVLLAGLSDAEVRRRFQGVYLEAFTDRSITDLETLLHSMDEIRLKGFGTDDGEYTKGVVCVAVPIRQHSGEVFAAMSVSVPEVRSSTELRRTALQVLLEQANAMSAELGYYVPGMTPQRGIRGAAIQSSIGGES